MKQLLRCWSLFFALLAALPLRAQLSTSAGASTMQAGTLVFKLRPALRDQSGPGFVSVPALQTALKRLGATGLRQKFPHTLAPDPEQPEAVDLRLIYQIDFQIDISTEKACRVLLQTGALEYAEPLYNRQPLNQPNDPLADSTRAGGQYYLKNIQAYRAWDVTKGDTSIVIAITDEGGGLTHEDLKAQAKRNYADPIDGLDNDHDGYVDNFYGWDFADNDNDPSRKLGSAHGGEVAGCASGRANNSLGIAGVGYNCKFLPLKIFPSTPAGRFAGFDAIVYAADHGCQVINMSWGGAGGRSQFEQDVISYAAVNRDAVLVAAAGNTSGDIDFYPASYDHVISVAMLTTRDEITYATTYSYHVALSAPGQDILTTYGKTDTDYANVNGSSFASPQVAGAAALVRARFPQYNARQVAAQLRQSADDLYAIPANAAYRDKLGKGRLNVYRAVALPDRHEVRVLASNFAPQRLAYPEGDTIRLAAAVQNILQPVDNLTVTLTSLSPYLTVRQGAFAVGSLPMLGRATNADKPFRLAVGRSVPLNTRAVLRYHFAANGYQDDQYVILILNPGFAVLDANDLRVTVASRGNLGYEETGSDLGQSVSYQGSEALLYEGGLLVATTSARVSDRIRNDRGGADQDFYQFSPLTLRHRPGPADQELSAIFRDSLPSLTRQRTVGIRVRQRAVALAAPPNRSYVVLLYTLQNITPDTLRPLYAGLFMDWDVVPEAGRNAAAWDSVRALGYAYDKLVPQYYAGVKLLQGGAATCYSIDNNAPAGTPVRLADGFSKAEKFLTLSSGTSRRTVDVPTGTDVSQVVGTRLRPLAPGDSVTVAFAVLGAHSLPELQAAATAAQTQFATVLPTHVAARTGGLQVYPNPTTGLLQVEAPSMMSLHNLLLINNLGKIIYQRKLVGTHTALDLRGYAPGVYVVQVDGQQDSWRQRVVLVP